MFDGEQMIEVFNRTNTRVTCLGNHDTDCGLAQMTKLINQTSSVWLMSNFYLEDGSVIGDLPRSHIMEH